MVPADRVEAVYEAARDGHGPRQRRGLHYTRDTLWPVAAHELRSTMGATGDANLDWQERVAVFDLKTVTVDSDQRATLADPVRIFADDIERMKQDNLIPLHRTAQAARLASVSDWVQADKWRQAREDAESEFRSVGRTHRDDETATMTPITGTIALGAEVL